MVVDDMVQYIMLKPLGDNALRTIDHFVIKF